MDNITAGSNSVVEMVLSLRFQASAAHSDELVTVDGEIALMAFSYAVEIARILP